MNPQITMNYIYEVKRHWKMTQPWSWHENMADLNLSVPSHLLPASADIIVLYLKRYPFIFSHRFVNSATMFLQQKYVW